MRIVVLVVLGFALFWWWIFYGSRDHCPSCGRSLVTYHDHDGPLLYSTRRRSCACGWHE